MAKNTASDKIATKEQLNTIHLTHEDNAFMMTATYFYEAADILMREYEKRLKPKGAYIRYSVKQRYNEILKLAHRLNYLNEQFVQDYTFAFDTEKELVDKSEMIRYVASVYAQLGILIADRCNLKSEALDAIFEFAKALESRGVVSPEAIDKLRVKR